MGKIRPVELSPQQQLVWGLKKSGMTIKEISETTELSTTTVRKYLELAEQKLELQKIMGRNR